MRVLGLLLVLIASVAQAGDVALNSLYGTRVSVSKVCPVKGGEQEAAFVPSLLASLLPALIDKAIDWTAAAAKAAGEAKAFPAETGTGTAAMLKSDGAGTVALDKGFGCVIVTSGEFGTAPPNSLTGNWQSKTLAGFGFARDPRFYIELRVMRSPDGAFFSLKPSFLYFREPSQTSQWSSDTRDLSLSLSFFAPGQKEPFASSSLLFKNLRPGADVTFGGTIAPMTTGYMPVPTVDDVAKSIVELEKAAITKYEKELRAAKDAALVKTSAEEARKRLESFGSTTEMSERVRAMGYPVDFLKWLKATCGVVAKHKKEIEHCPDDLFWATEELRYVTQLSQAIAAGVNQPDVTPPKAPEASPALLVSTNIQATIVESRDGSEFMRLVGEVLDGSKDDLKKNIKSALQSERAKAKDEQQGIAEDLLILAAGERAKVKKLEAELTQETDPVKRAELEGDLVTARLKANKAFRKANLDQRYEVSL